MKVGYARVSTDDQNLDLQEDALLHAGCARIYRDKGVSGAEFKRPGLTRALRALKPGDTLVVWRLDRLGRSLPKLLDIVASLERRGVQFESLTEMISTNSPGGVLIFQLMGALAQFERTLISERTKAGLAAARQRGTVLGRRPALTAAQRTQALLLMESRSTTEVAKAFNVHPKTLQRLARNAAACQTEN